MPLHIVDVSRYQVDGHGNLWNLQDIPDLDGVIIGVTFGCSGANPTWKDQLNMALDDPRDLVIGFYHIRNQVPHTPEEEAAFFLNELSTHPRINERPFTTHMDSEEHPAGTAVVDWVYQWNEYIGARRAYPLTYVGQQGPNSIKELNWDLVAQKSSLWGAQYDYSTPEQGWDDSRELLGDFSYPIGNGEFKEWPVVAGHQYSSTTYFNGMGPFDVSLFFEDKTAWYRYAGAASVVNDGVPLPAPVVEVAPAPPAPQVENPVLVSPNQCTVSPGDSLGSIATQFNTSVNAILGLNPWITNPNYIQAGWVLNLPSTSGAPSGTVYVVQSGDTLGGIASRYGTDYQTLADYNGIPDPNVIYAGQQIRIP